ncbi:ABC transporter permease, partial [Rhizobiaceae sp. 2RAB30]
MTRDRILWLAGSLAVAAFFVLLWYGIAINKLVSPVFLPGPDRAWAALVKGMTTGDLAVKLAATVERMVWGWLIASLIGIALGAAIGTSPALRAYL